MARQARIVLPEYPHHVILRGNNRRTLFSQAPDFQHFIFLMGRAQLFSPCELLAATLMTNHVHLVLRPRDQLGMARFVKHLSQRYAQSRNQKRGGSGRLFEERYFSKPILDEDQLAVTLAYVELNPVRAGLRGSVGEYPWSTYRCHVPNEASRFPRALWTPSTWYLALGNSTQERSRRYASWVAECRASDRRPDDVTLAEAKSELVKLQANTRVRRPDETRAA